MSRIEGTIPLRSVRTNLPMNQRLLSVLKPVRGGFLAATVIAGTAIVSGSIAFGASSKPSLGLAKPQTLAIKAEPLGSFSRAGGSDPSNGPLVWRGGLALSAETDKFGGFSGLLISADGRDLLAVSDAGGWLKGRIDYSGARPVGLSAASIGSLVARDGNPLRRNRERDAEDLALVSGTLAKGEILVAYEQNNRIVRYAVSNGVPGRPLQVIAPPAALRKFSRNGIEAMTVMRGGPHKGRIVAFSENAGSNERHAGWIWIGADPKPLNVLSRGGFALTSAASLPDGTLLLLERRFTIFEGVRMRLRRIDATAVKPGALLDGEVLIEADMSGEIDNMEGLAVHTAENGDTVLTIISDDNFNRTLQRTLLLQFTLLPRARS
ncbi:MAG: hypothetical protein C0519_13045 [Hyphomicrobium sp.]|nr:hypothetical protein [Hyphomicrobium sp.]PPD09058.1 MAG: hypothetical protein CTY28_03105 [Hyphomicrobium sp.]